MITLLIGENIAEGEHRRSCQILAMYTTSKFRVGTNNRLYRILLSLASYLGSLKCRLRVLWQVPSLVIPPLQSSFIGQIIALCLDGKYIMDHAVAPIRTYKSADNAD